MISILNYRFIDFLSAHDYLNHQIKSLYSQSLCPQNNRSTLGGEKTWRCDLQVVPHTHCLSVCLDLHTRLHTSTLFLANFGRCFHCDLDFRLVGFLAEIFCQFICVSSFDQLISNNSWLCSRYIFEWSSSAWSLTSCLNKFNGDLVSQSPSSRWRVHLNQPSWFDSLLLLKPLSFCLHLLQLFCGSSFGSLGPSPLYQSVYFQPSRRQHLLPFSSVFDQIVLMCVCVHLDQPPTHPRVSHW